MTENIKKTKLSEYSTYPFDLNRAMLVFQLDAHRTIVRTRLFFNRLDPNCSEIVLNGEGLEIISLKLSGALLAESDFSYQNDILIIKCQDEKFELETEVAIDPSSNKALSGLYLSGGRLTTQCEAEGMRRITFWPDRPDVLTRYFVRLEADKKTYPYLLSNGNPVTIGDYGDGRHFAEWDDPWPKPSYLFALVAGDFDVLSDSFEKADKDKVELNIFCEKGQADKALYAMDSLKRAMKWDEEVYDRLYDLDVFNIVAVRDFNAGAMENKGLNIFNSSLLLADAQTATDADYARIESVVAHEYFHNWSGNRVTCRDWFQLSLKEGFTVFRDQEFSKDMRSRAVVRIQNVQALRSSQFPEDQGPNAHPVRPQEYVSIDNFYTSTVYNKGAEVISIAKAMLGDKNFFKGAIEYFENNDGRAATIEDWLFALRSASGNPMEGMEKWYSQAGTPILEVNSEYKDQKFVLSIKQHTPNTPNQFNKEWVPIPLSFTFYNEKGERIILSTQDGQEANRLSFVLNRDELAIDFHITERPIFSCLHDFSAPVILKTNRSDADLAILAGHDDNSFVRWESLQTIARNAIIDAMENNAGAPPSLISAMANAIHLRSQDKAFAALLLQLPFVGELIQMCENAEPEKIFAAREKIAKELSDALKSAFLAIHDEYDFAQEFVPDANGEGARSLHNVALYYLSFQDGFDKELYENSLKINNMTDHMGILSALSRIGGDYWQKALNDFEAKWQKDDMVMDKWFSIQSGAPLSTTIEKIKTLAQRSDFSIENPNRVRSVYGAFAMGNHIGFHAANGAGYQAVCEFLSKYDKINPSVAARLATSFERCVIMNSARKELAKSSLENLLNKDTSKQLQEIVTSVIKCL